MRFIQLEVSRLSAGETAYQTLSISLSKPQILMAPDVIAAVQLPVSLDLSREVVIFGQAPIWLYARLVRLCQAAPWVGCYAARDQQIVVVHSRVAELAVGDAVPVRLNQTPCPAILIGGPPNSGKSVFSNALRQVLQQPQRRVFLHRASWDGEGNWTYETGNSALVESLVRQNEYRIHEDPATAKLIPSYFQQQARTVQNLRRLTDCLLVDVGGLPQPEKLPLVEQCSHYIVISRLPDEVAKWHGLCRPHLEPLAVIHSVLEPTQTIVKQAPLLEVVAGPWRVEREPELPPAVLAAVLSSCQLG
ncbi:MAG: CRISPR-associated protein Csx3 [Leptolyngbya sp. SIO4C1]|nr:CRISPR-associated protein Csx3 [Leptolyngbya sp. SIO4C1]